MRIKNRLEKLEQWSPIKMNAAVNLGEEMTEADNIVKAMCNDQTFQRKEGESLKDFESRVEKETRALREEDESAVEVLYFEEGEESWSFLSLNIYMNDEESRVFNKRRRSV